MHDLNQTVATATPSSHCTENEEQEHQSLVSEQNNNRLQISMEQKITDFPQKDSVVAGKSISERNSFHSSLVMDYITRAGYHISQAVEYEAQCQFECAFASYKAAISNLLSGIQGHYFIFKA